jgi:type I restriction enzyme, S subunit
MAQLNLNTALVRRFPLGLPPLAEQQRIVGKVDELMVLCDRLEAAQAERETQRDRLAAASLNRLNHPSAGGAHTFREYARFHLRHLPLLTARPDQIPQLRQTILNLAVRGQLVSQDPRDEPASDLLKRIAAKKEQLINKGVIRKEKQYRPVTADEAPFNIPTNWNWARIGACSLVTEYGTSVKSHNIEQGVPVLKMGDIQNGKVVLGGQKKVPRDIDELPQLFLKRLDLLYNRTNSAELVGKTGIYLGEDNKYTFASYLIRIQFLTEMMNPLYSNLAMNAPYFRATQIVPELQQQCGQANVNGTKLRNMLLPVPPLSEQHRIVARVEELMALCDRLESQLTTGQNEKGHLLESVLHEALSVN